MSAPYKPLHVPAPVPRRPVRVPEPRRPRVEPLPQPPPKRFALDAKGYRLEGRRSGLLAGGWQFRLIDERGDGMVCHFGVEDIEYLTSWGAAAELRREVDAAIDELWDRWFNFGPEQVEALGPLLTG